MSMSTRKNAKKAFPIRTQPRRASKPLRLLSRPPLRRLRGNRNNEKFRSSTERISTANPDNNAQVLVLPLPMTTIEILTMAKTKADMQSRAEQFRLRAIEQFAGQETPSNLEVHNKLGVQEAGELVYYHGRVYMKLTELVPESENEGDAITLRQLSTPDPHTPEQQVAQVVFFCSGELRLHNLPTPDGRFHPRLGAFECGSVGQHSDLCYTFSGDMIKYERKLRKDIISLVYDWVTIFLATFPVAETMLHREGRIQRWREYLEPKCIKVILRGLAPGVDLDVVTATPFWLEWAQEIITVLADDIFLFHYASEGNEDYVDVLLHRHMQKMRQTRKFPVKSPFKGHLFDVE